MADKPVVVIGAGIAGLCAAIRLVAGGVRVVVFDHGEAPGGKMRQVATATGPVDSGPTVFTMRAVFEELLEEIDLNLADLVDCVPLDLLARHAWSQDSRLDLYADRGRSADAIGDFAGSAEARGYLAFCAEAKRMFEVLEQSMLRASKPNPLSLAWRARSHGLPALLGLKPFSSMWQALGRHFADPRLLQLFGRYATYCGSSPWRAPATLMLIAHLEQEGVWQLTGGMQSLALGLARAAESRGVEFRFGEPVAEILMQSGQVSGVRTAVGDIDCEAVVCTADPASLRAGLLGESAASAISPGKRSERSLSAVTWSMSAVGKGFPLAYHNVFFSGDYRREFAELFERRSIPSEPTVYVCAQDRAEFGEHIEGQAERLFCLVNAPAIGDEHSFPGAEIEACEQRMFQKLADCGLEVSNRIEPATVRTPAEFASRFPGSGGAIYGQATHGWAAAFRRPGARTRLPGLYLAGGGVHPGAGVPMVALSGRQAAHCLLKDRALTNRWWPTVTVGGTSTH